MPTPTPNDVFDSPIILPPETINQGTGSITHPSAPTYGLPYVPEIDFAVKDPTVIEHEVITDYETAFEGLTGIAKKLAPGDPVRLFLLAVCNWLSHQRALIDFTGKNNLLKYAKEDYLDNLAALHGNRTLRLPAAAAICTLRFSLEAPLAFSVVVPKGTQCQAPNGIIFVTLKDAVIPGIGDALAPELEGVVEVAARALEAGSIGNGFLPGQVNSIINWNQPFALRVVNTTETKGGSDAESDDQYRYRIWLAIESYSTCGPRAAYEFWALSAHPDIIQVVVYSAPDIAGEVHLYPLMKGGNLPTQTILDLVLAKCSADTVRPVTDYVFAHAPTEFTYALNMDYWVLGENEVLLGTIIEGVQQAVTDWILWQRSNVGRDINTDELRKRCLEAGAKRILVHTPTPGFQVLAYNQLAVHSAATPIINFAGLEAQ